MKVKIKVLFIMFIAFMSIQVPITIAQTLDMKSLKRDQGNFESALDDIWKNKIKLVSTPSNIEISDELFQRDIDESECSSTEINKADSIVSIIQTTSYENLLEVYYQNSSDAYSDLTDTGGGIPFDRTHDINPDYMYDKVQLEDSFNKIKGEAKQFALHFVKAFPDSSEESFKENSAKYLSVASYLYRWFNVPSDISKTNLWEIMYFRGNTLFQEEETMVWNSESLLSIVKILQADVNQTYPTYYTFGLLKGKKIESRFVCTTTEDLNVYESNGEITYKSVIEQFLNRCEKTTDYNSWFKKNFHGYLYEDTSVPEKYQETMWNKVPKNLLPFYLTAKKQGSLVIFNTMKYTVVTDTLINPNYAIGLAHASMTMNQYFQTVERTMDDGQGKIDRFINSVIYDNGLNQEGKAEFSNKNNALDYSIYSPAGYFVPLCQQDVNAMTGMSYTLNIFVANIYYGNTAKIDYLSQYTLAHEFTHALYPIIHGDETESYYLEGGYGELPGNNFFDTSGSAGAGYDNSTPLRFQDKSDLKQYNKRYDQLIDILNLAIADVVLKQPVSELTKYLGRAEIDANGNLVKISSLTEKEISELNLKSYKDLIKNNIIIKSPGQDYFSTGYTLSQAQYYITLGNERIFNKLFGQDGWEALNPFNTSKMNEGNLDKALQASYKDATLTSSKLIDNDMKEVAGQLAEYGTVIGTFEEIKEKFNQDTENIDTVKRELIQQAMKKTDEFRDDIYGPSTSHDYVFTANNLTVKTSEVSALDILKASNASLKDTAHPEDAFTLEVKDKGGLTNKVGSYQVTLSAQGLTDVTKTITVKVVADSKPTPPTPSVEYQAVYRLYNKNTGEHFYTESSFERDSLVKGGWNNEGTGWSAPTSGTAVYRVYNPNATGGDHYYTASQYEAQSLVKAGWKWDNGGKPVFYSGGKTPVYVAFNPNATASGSHNFTSSSYEQQSLLNNGWKYGKVQFYGK